MSSKLLLLERVLPIAILVLAALAAPVMIFSNSGLPRLNRLRAERVEAREQVSRLRQQIRELRAGVSSAKQDLRSVERTARDRLGLVRQTELVFQFED